MASVKTSENFYSDSNSREQDTILLKPFADFVKIKGKDTKYLSKVIKTFNHWLNISEDKVVIIENITIMRDDAANLLDSLKDDSILDKGAPTVHSLYGIPSVINAANYVTTIALDKVIALHNPDAYLILMIQRCKELYLSMKMEYDWSDLSICPTEEEYKKMCSLKKGSSFKSALEMMQVDSENKNDFIELCNMLGVFFGVYEDFVNLFAKKGTYAELYRNCLSARKYNFLIVHAMKNQKEFSPLFKIFQHKVKDDVMVKYILSFLEDAGSFDYAKNTLVNLKKEIEKEMDKFGKNVYLLSILDDMLIDIKYLSM